MPTEFDIAVGVLNRAEIKKLEKDIDDLEKKIEDVGEAFNNGTITQEAFNASLRVNGAAISSARSKIAALAEENKKLGQSTEDLSSKIESLATNLSKGIDGIEGIAASLGAAGGLGLAISGAVTVIKLVSDHWQDLQDIFGNVSGIENAKTWVETFTDALRNMSYGSEAIYKTADAIDEAQARLEQRRAVRAEESKRAAQGKAAIEGLRPEAEELRGKDFLETVKQYGQKRLLQEMVTRLAGGAAITEGQRAYLKEEAYKQIQRGVSGAQTPESYEGIYGKEFVAKRREILTKRGEDVTDKAMIDADAKLTHELEKQGRENFQEGERQRRADEKADKDRIKMLEEAGRKNEEFGRMQLEDEKKQLERQKRDMIEAAHEMRTPHMFESTAAMLKSMQTAILGDVAKEQLREAKLLNQKIDGVNDKLDALRVARVAP